MKEKVQLEYILDNISLNVLWNCISTPSGLSEWFADNVNISEKIYTFSWKEMQMQAELIGIRTGYYIRFHWIEEEDSKTYFEMKINPDELTGDVALVITDFMSEDEKKDNIKLWDNLIDELKRKAGM